MYTSKRPTVSIGLPVYNGGKFIEKRLESILLQTMTNFELIISDNGSTDATSKICKEFEKKDERVRYIRQEKNMGAVWNWYFVLKEAKCDYFVCAADDDLWEPTFLEKNTEILDTNKDVVGSIGDVSYSNIINYKFKSDNNTKTDFKKYKYVKSAYGTYEKKVRVYLEFLQASIIYGVYRRKELQKSIATDKYFSSSDLAMILSVLKYGNLHVIDENLLHRYDKGSHSIIQTLLKLDVSPINVIFLEFPFTFWCLKNLGFKIFIKNFDLFVKINLRGEYAIIAETIRIIKRVIFRQEKFW